MEVSGGADPLDAGNTFSVTFTGVNGDVPLLTPDPANKATVSSTTEGAAPYRKEIQAFSCTGSVGSLLINWRGILEVTVAADDDLDTLKTLISSSLTPVTVAGVSPGAVCSGDLVYVTFEEVSSSLIKPFDPSTYNQLNTIGAV